MGPGPQLAQLGLRVRGARPRAARRRADRCTRCSGASRGRCAFVNSFGLGDPPSCRHAARAASTATRDCASSSTPQPAWIARRARGARAPPAPCDAIDFKGQYGLEVKDPDALAPLYERVVELFPDAVLEDPHDLPGIAERCSRRTPTASPTTRRSARSPTSTATPIRAAIVNVKPCRVGRPARRCSRSTRTARRDGIAHVRRRDGRARRRARADPAARVALPRPTGPTTSPRTRYNDERPARRACRRARSTRLRRPPASAASRPRGGSSLSLPHRTPVGKELDPARPRTPRAPSVRCEGDRAAVWVPARVARRTGGTRGARPRPRGSGRRPRGPAGRRGARARTALSGASRSARAAWRAAATRCAARRPAGVSCSATARRSRGLGSRRTSPRATRWSTSAHGAGVGQRQRAGQGLDALALAVEVQRDEGGGPRPLEARRLRHRRPHPVGDGRAPPDPARLAARRSLIRPPPASAAAAACRAGREMNPPFRRWPCVFRHARGSSATARARPGLGLVAGCPGRSRRPRWRSRATPK